MSGNLHVTLDAHQQHVQSVIELIRQNLKTDERTVLAIAGPPASGKTTLAASVVDELNRRATDAPDLQAALLPMDGYHLDNATLDRLGLRARKGAVNTFDAEGFCAAIRAVATLGLVLTFPGFDRDKDCVVKDQIRVEASTQIIVTEGNYLLLDRKPWRDVRASFAATVFVKASLVVLEQRLMARWCDQRLPVDVAAGKVRTNDLPNAEQVLRESIEADLLIEHRESNC